uniref:Uncharacterized protein n=1 Tax=Rhizophora mucronata TaxID=61149 RepID=A0A2P2IP52_RHIMU
MHFIEIKFQLPEPVTKAQR